MKCGKDLDASVNRNDDLTFDIPDSGSFTPQGSPDDGMADRSKVTADENRSGESFHGGLSDPHPAADVINVEFSEASEARREEFGEAAPEIRQVGVTSDITDRRVICDRCGFANLREQRYCQHCAAPLGDTIPGGDGDALHRDWGYGKDYDRLPPYSPDDAEPYQYANGAPGVPLARGDVLAAAPEISFLTDAAPSSDYYSVDIGEERRGAKKARGAGGRGWSAREWGVREWLTIIVISLVLFGIAWLFLLGGLEIFSGKVRNIKKAGEAMAGLGSFDFQITGSMESFQAGNFGGAGRAMFESPDLSSWQFTTNFPNRDAIVTQQMLVSGKDYVNRNGLWIMVDQGKARFDVKKLWSDFSAVEDLGQSVVGGVACLHYRYRVAPEFLTALFGDWQPDGVPDAVIETFIDAGDRRVLKLTARIFNLQIDGARVTATLTFELASTGQPLNIRSPI
jgi:hypothetical protein